MKREIQISSGEFLSNRDRPSCDVSEIRSGGKRWDRPSCDVKRWDRNCDVPSNNDPYGYGTIRYQGYCANQPYTPQVISHNTQTSGGLASIDCVTQTDLWNDASNAMVTGDAPKWQFSTWDRSCDVPSNNDPYGYGTIAYQGYCANQPHTPQVISHNTQTSGGLASIDGVTQTDLWNDASKAMVTGNAPKWQFWNESCEFTRREIINHSTFYSRGSNPLEFLPADQYHLTVPRGLDPRVS